MLPNLDVERAAERLAREHLDAARLARRARRRRAFLVLLRLAILAALLWAAWRVGFETAAVTVR